MSFSAHSFSESVRVRRVVGVPGRAWNSVTRTSLSCIMYDMKAVPVRELQREIRAILDRVEKGESLEITRRGRPVARLVPARPVRAEAWPDLDARARKVLGPRHITPPPSQQLVADRGDR
jgi:prevent-host-death family protein